MEIRIYHGFSYDILLQGWSKTIKATPKCVAIKHMHSWFFLFPKHLVYDIIQYAIHHFSRS
jgi:hypothetical protein